MNCSSSTTPSHDSEKIIKGRELKFTYTQGVGPTLFTKLRTTNNETAQIDGITGEKDTFSALTKRCVRTAIAMRSRGITSDDLITVCSTNHLNTCVPMIASYFLDVKMAHTDPTLSLDDTVYLLKLVQPKLVFVSPNAVKLIEEALREIGSTAEIVVFGETSKHVPFSEFLVESKEETNFKPVAVDDLSKTAIILFSSGSTGNPKGICLSHRSLLAQTLIAEQAYITTDNVILMVSPPYWISYTSVLLDSVIHKYCRLIIPEMKIDEFWGIIEKYKVTAAGLSPTKIATMVQCKRPTNANISSLRYLSFAGCPFSGEMVEAARAMFPNVEVFAGYGQTEVGGMATYFQIANAADLDLALKKVTSSGQVMPGLCIKISDPDSENTLGPNQIGEIRFKSEYLMNGYYNLNSSDQWDKDGFLKSGDLGYYDEDRYFFIVDRLKEMFKYQSWHIVPIKIESILMQHPAVETALAIGIPHPIDNSHPMAIVTLKKSHLGTVTAEDIRKFVDDQVDDKYKLRAGVKIVKELAQTPSEKLKRKYIKDLVIAGKI